MVTRFWFLIPGMLMFITGHVRIVSQTFFLKLAIFYLEFLIASSLCFADWNVKFLFIELNVWDRTLICRYFAHIMNQVYLAAIANFWFLILGVMSIDLQVIVLIGKFCEILIWTQSLFFWFRDLSSLLSQINTAWNLTLQLFLNDGGSLRWRCSSKEAIRGT